MTLTELAVVITILVIFVSALWYVAGQVQENRNYNKTMAFIGNVMNGMKALKASSPQGAQADITTPQTLDMMGMSRDIWDPVNNIMVDPYGGAINLVLTANAPDGQIIFNAANGNGGLNQARCIYVLTALLNTPTFYSRLKQIAINGQAQTNSSAANNITKANLIGLCNPGLNTFLIEFSL